MLSKKNVGNFIKKEQKDYSMPLDDFPEISYQELNICAVELFEPGENPLEYIRAVKEDFTTGRFERYASDELFEVIKNVREAHHSLPLEMRLRKNRNYHQIRDQLVEKMRDKHTTEERQAWKDGHQYTLEDFVKSPFKGISFKSIWDEMQEDLDFSDLFSGKRKLLKVNLTAFASFGIFSLPHELIHAGTNYLTGGTNKEIVINTLYGGPLWEKIIPGIESKVLFPLIGGYVKFENPSTIGTLTTTIAPYVLTPIGIYLMKKGKERESIVICAGGACLGLLHLGGIIGDWRMARQKMIKESAELVQDSLNLRTSPEYADAATFAMFLGGLYIGSKLLAVSYRASKATVNSVTKYVNKEKL